MSKMIKQQKTFQPKNFEFQHLKDALQYGHHDESITNIYYGDEWKSINTISELIAFVSKRIPLNSPEMTVINKLIADYLKPIYGKEYILVRSVCHDASPYERKRYKDNKEYETIKDPYGNYYLFSPRYTVEWNAGFSQFSVSCILKIGDKVILLKSKKGFLNGKITMIQGHCSYELTSDYVGIYSHVRVDENKGDFQKYFKNQMKRELFEEVAGITEDDIESIRYLTHIYPNYKDPSNVSYYHEGPCFIVTLKDREGLLEKISSGEPHKHDVVIFTDEEFGEYVRNNKESMDDWLREAVEAL